MPRLLRRVYSCTGVPSGVATKGSALMCHSCGLMDLQAVNQTKPSAAAPRVAQVSFDCIVAFLDSGWLRLIVTLV